MAIPNSQLVNPVGLGKQKGVSITIPKTPLQEQQEKVAAALERINTAAPKGLEKVFDLINEFILKIIVSTNTLMYGKGSAIPLPNQYAARTVNSASSVENSKVTGIQKALDRGILNLLKELARVDFCNLLNYVLKLPKGVAFDPNKPPSDLSTFEGIVWRTQKRAFQGQQLIDKYYSIYGDLSLPNANLELRNVLRELTLLTSELSSPLDGLQNAEFKKRFPEASNFIELLSGATTAINRYSGLQNLTPSDFEKALTNINKIRATLQAITSLNLANVVGVANFISNGKVLEDFNKVNQFVVPGPKVLELLKKIIKGCNNIVDVANKVLRVVTTAQTIIRLLLILLKSFYIIREFLFGNPIPSAFGTMGSQIVLDDLNQTTLKEKLINRFVARINQIVETLSLISIAATFLISIMTDVINLLKIIIFNIQSCYPDIADEMQQTVNNLTNSRDQLQKFLDDYDNAKNRVDNTFGGYTIEIITEQLADENISLKRRYGIARSAKNTIDVQSTPTFASLDLIIINEVKVLLVSKGLVNIGGTGVSTDEAAILIEASNYLGDSVTDLDNIQFTVSDMANLDEEQDDQGIGLSKFINNLPGGKALRSRVRKRMRERSANLSEDLKRNNS